MYLQNTIIGPIWLKLTYINFLSVASLNLLHSNMNNITGSCNTKQPSPKMYKIHAYDH